MIKLLLQPVNFLILDEPTNHLDMTTKDILKEAIRDFNGTVIVVSHDRYFLDGLVEKVYEFGGGKVRENLGGIYDFLRKKNIESLNQLELSRSPSQKAPAPQKSDSSQSAATEETPNPQQAEAPKSRKLSYFEQKEQAKLLSKAEKRVKQAEADIETLEELQKSLEEKIANGDSSTETLDAYAKVGKDMENAMSHWELAQTELEELKEKMNS